ncbi:MAG: hypothetical protein H7Y38_08590, partial [Armatimonadetes bacterium]|nr:hypothetical protein [Armatimonadota bacterium]
MARRQPAAPQDTVDTVGNEVSAIPLDSTTDSVTADAQATPSDTTGNEVSATIEASSDAIPPGDTAAAEPVESPEATIEPAAKPRRSRRAPAAPADPVVAEETAPVSDASAPRPRRTRKPV